MPDHVAPSNESMNGQLVQVNAGAVSASGLLHVPPNAHGLVLIPHGSLDNDLLDRNAALALANTFFQVGLATLVVDLFSTEEQQLNDQTGFFHANTSIMEQRITGTAEWLLQEPLTQHLSIGYFGVGITGSAALIAAAERPDVVAAIVAVAGQLAPAQKYLPRILSPTMLIAVGNDATSQKAHEDALAQIAVEKRLEHLDNMGDDIGRLATEWFGKHLVLIGE